MSRQAGFTLLEIMVALVVFGFLMIGLTQGVHFGLRAWNGQARLMSQRGDLDAADRTLRGLITRMAPGSRTAPPDIFGRPHGFAFTTTLPPGVPGGVRHANVILTVDRHHDLVLRWTAHRHATRLTGRPLIRETILLARVARVDFAYWHNGHWLTTWAGRNPPALVRIRIRLVGTTWPAIVVAPMRRSGS